MQISRQLGKENWNIDEFLQCINREITARESYEFLKNEKGKKEESFSNSSLLSAGKLSHTRKCLFCYKTDHYSDQCQIVTDLKARREILKKNRICFKCLKPGHTKPNCKSSIKCYKCKKKEIPTLPCAIQTKLVITQQRKRLLHALLKITRTFYYRRQMH